MHVDEQFHQDKLDQLTDEYTRGGLSRRQFITRGVALGLSMSAVGSLLAACGNNGSGSTNTVNLLSVWGGTEQDSFKAVIAPFTSQKGITVNLESTRDLDAVLTTRIRGNNPPDIAILPNPGKMQQLANQNHLISLDRFLDMNQIHTDYAKAWTDLGTFNGKFYALFYKAANKGTIWYSPDQFSTNSYQIPPTWDALIALSDSIAGSGKFPWSMGVESGSASGWPSADWIAQIFLNQSGPDKYDQWVAHKIPWTDSSVKAAFQQFSGIVHGNHYINGAPQAVLATNFQPATYAPYTSPPQAYMNYLGDFAAGFISKQFPNVKAGTGYNFFPFPQINAQYQGSVTGGADVVVALRDNSAVKQVVQYLATAPAQAIWVKRGGFTSVNKSLDLAAYPDAVAQASAKMLTTASTFRFGAGDLMPPAVQLAFWKGMLSFIGDKGQLDTVLSSIEAAAQQAYTS